jgi:hypothetical protein
MDAPEGVWSRIESEIEATAPEPGPELAKVFALERPESSVADPVAPAVEDRSPRRPPMWLLGAAAALALVVAGGLLVASGRTDTGGDPLADALAAAEAVAVGVIDQDGHGYLDASALPQLAPDQTYQLWGVIAENGDAVSLGILGSNPELETFTVESDVAALAVTIEQSPGVISDGNPDGAFVGRF